MNKRRKGRREYDACSDRMDNAHDRSDNPGRSRVHAGAAGAGRDHRRVPDDQGLSPVVPSVRRRKLALRGIALGALVLIVLIGGGVKPIEAEAQVGNPALDRETWDFIRKVLTDIRFLPETGGISAPTIGGGTWVSDPEVGNVVRNGVTKARGRWLLPRAATIIEPLPQVAGAVSLGFIVGTVIDTKWLHMRSRIGAESYVACGGSVEATVRWYIQMPPIVKDFMSGWEPPGMWTVPISEPFWEARMIDYPAGTCGDIGVPFVRTGHSTASTVNATLDGEGTWLIFPATPTGHPERTVGMYVITIEDLPIDFENAEPYDGQGELNTYGTPDAPIGWPGYDSVEGESIRDAISSSPALNNLLNFLIDPSEWAPPSPDDPGGPVEPWNAPNCVGMTVGECRSAFEDAAGNNSEVTFVELDIGFEGADLELPAEAVVTTTPAPNQVIQPGPIEVTIKRNPVLAEMPIIIPDVSDGDTYDIYLEKLRQRGWLGTSDHEERTPDTADPTKGPDEVVKIIPIPGTRIRPNDPVIITTNPPDWVGPMTPPIPGENGCPTPMSTEIDFGPISEAGLQDKFPFAIFAWTHNVLGSWLGSSQAPSFGLSVLGHGFEVDLSIGNSAMAVIRPTLVAIAAFMMFWWFATSLLGLRN